MMGWATAVLVDVVVLPLESVEVMETMTATGVLGRATTGAGEGVMTMPLDVVAGVLETTGSVSLAGC